MIVFQNSLMTLVYTPDHDILSVDWPDVEPFVVTEFKDSLEKLVETLNSYDVKNLLIDGSRAKVNISYPEYQALIHDFAAGLRTTRMKRVGRVKTTDPDREACINAVREQSVSSYEFQDFQDKTEAIRWLQSPAL